MATWYVDYENGDNTHGDGTETWVDTDESGTWTAGDTGPWKTIRGALAKAEVTDGDTIIVKYGASGNPDYIALSNATSANKTVTVQGETGQAGMVTVNPASGVYLVYDTTDANTGTITFRDIHFDASVSTRPCVYSTKSKGMTFIDCTFTNPATADTPVVNAKNTNSPTRILKFINCTFINTGAKDDTISSGSGDIIADGCTMTASGSRNFAIATSISNIFSITNNRIVVTNCYSNAIHAGFEYVDDATWDANLDKWSDVDFVIGNLASNDGVMYICVQDHTAVGTDVAVTEPGTGTAWKQYWEIYQSPAKVIISGNHLVITDSTPAHAVFCGPEIYGATISDNYITGGNYQIVNKGRMGAIRNNISIGPFPCYLVGGNNMLIEGNTFVDTGTTGALVMGLQFSGLHSSQNRIVNNVLYSAGSAAIRWISDIDIEDYVDYNCYWRANDTDLVYLYAATAKTFAEMAALWPTKSILFGHTNDTHSINVNPMLNSDYKATSKALSRSGTPSIYKTNGTLTGYNSIGAREEVIDTFFRKRRII